MRNPDNRLGRTRIANNAGVQRHLQEVDRVVLLAHALHQHRQHQ